MMVLSFLVYILIAIFVFVSLWLINYHIKRFGIDEMLDKKVLKIMNFVVFITFFINSILFFLVPWQKISEILFKK